MDLVEILRYTIEIKVGLVISFCCLSAAMGVAANLFIGYLIKKE